MSKQFLGKVVDNKDPKFMGRVRIRINSIHQGVPDNELPWATSQTGSGGHGSIDVPSIGDQVYTSFQGTDGHELMYTGNVTKGGALHPDFKTNYPNRKGYTSESGVIFWRDEQTGDMSFNSPGGLQFYLNAASGLVTITAADIKVMGNVEINGNLKVVGNLEVTGDTTLKDTTINGINQVND